MTYRYLSLATLVAAFPLGAAIAGGFQTLPQSAPALGIAGAVTATSRDASATWFNPGALGMLDSASVMLGASALRVGRIFRSETTSRAAQANAQFLPTPHLYAAAPIGHGLVVGLSLNSPFGYETKWPTDWQGRALATETRIRTAYAQPTVAYQVSDRFSVGAGFIVAAADYRSERSIGELPAGAVANYKASGTGYGFNIGIKGRAGDAVSFGIAYRSAVKVDMTNGEASFSGIPTSQTALYPATAAFGTKVNLPGMLSAGISNRVTDKLLLNFTFELTGWSVYDSLNVSFSEKTIAPQRSGRRYEDAMAFRVGAEYQQSDKLIWRLGLYYDESPVRDQNISVDLPDANQLGGTVGVGYQLGARLRVDAAYTYALSASRTASPIGAVVVPPLAGQFRNNQHGGALTLGYQF